MFGEMKTFYRLTTAEKHVRCDNWVYYIICPIEGALVSFNMLSAHRVAHKASVPSQLSGYIFMLFFLVHVLKCMFCFVFDSLFIPKCMIKGEKNHALIVFLHREGFRFCALLWCQCFEFKMYLFVLVISCVFIYLFQPLRSCLITTDLLHLVFLDQICLIWARFMFCFLFFSFNRLSVTVSMEAACITYVRTGSTGREDSGAARDQVVLNSVHRNWGRSWGGENEKMTSCWCKAKRKGPVAWQDEAHQRCQQTVQYSQRRSPESGCSERLLYTTQHNIKSFSLI